MVPESKIAERHKDGKNYYKGYGKELAPKIMSMAIKYLPEMLLLFPQYCLYFVATHLSQIKSEVK